ncbi:hypothetical protein ACTXG6_34090 [Pseudonocardia sp. Cha107L01]
MTNISPCRDEPVPDQHRNRQRDQHGDADRQRPGTEHGLRRQTNADAKG